MRRRRFIQGLAVAGGITAAGCLGGNGVSGEGSTPPYGRWMPASHPTGEPMCTLNHVKWADQRRLFGARESSAVGLENLRSQRPLLGSALAAGYAHTQDIDVNAYPFDDDIFAGPATEETVDGINTTAASLAPHPTMVFHGEYDPDVFEDEYADEYERRDSDNARVFVREDSQGTISEAYAVAEHAVVVSPSLRYLAESRANRYVEQTLNTYEGEVDRLDDRNGGQWMLETLGDASFVLGFWHDQSDTPLFSEDVIRDNPAYDNTVFTNMTHFGFGLGTTFTGETSLGNAEARFSGVYTDADAVPERDTIASGLITSDDVDYDISIEQNHVSLTADVTADLVDMLSLG